MWIFAEVSLEGALNGSRVVVFVGYLFVFRQDMQDIEPIDGLSVIPKWMTLNVPE